MNRKHEQDLPQRGGSYTRTAKGALKPVTAPTRPQPPKTRPADPAAPDAEEA